MRLFKIAEALQTTDGNVIESIQARVTNIDKHYPWNSGGKSGTLQKITVQDETGSIGVQIWNGAPIPANYVGQTAYITAGQSNGQNGGLCGLLAATDKKSGQKVIKATEKAVVQFGQAQQAQQPPQAPPAQTFTPPPRPAAQIPSYDEAAQPTFTRSAPPAAAPVQQTFTPAAQAAPTTNGNGTDVRHHLAKSANLYLYCIQAGVYVRRTHDEMFPDKPMTDDQYQACVSSLFIQADRSLMVSKCEGGTFKG